MKIAECADAWLRAVDDRERVLANEALAAAVRASVLVVVRRRVSGTPAEDLAQEATSIILKCIERGDVTKGKEDAFAAACARSAVSQFYRRQAREERLLGDLGASLADAPEPEDAEKLLLSHVEQKRREAMAKAVAEVLTKAPPRYRWVLEEVYTHGRSIEDLAKGELRRRQELGEAGSGEDAQVRARNSVDQWLCRARQWVFDRAWKLLEEQAD